MKEFLKNAFESLQAFLNRGKTAYFVCIGLIILGTALVYGNPRSIPSFLLFVFSGQLHLLAEDEPRGRSWPWRCSSRWC